MAQPQRRHVSNDGSGSPPKKYSLFVLAILLLLLGGAALFLGARNFAIRAAGVVACIVSVYLVRISHVHAGPAVSTEADQGADIKGKKRPGRLIWMVGAAFLLLAGGSFLYLYQDAVHGYHEVLPIYIFAGVGLACALVWSYLFARLMR